MVFFVSDFENSDILKISNGLQQIISNVSTINLDITNVDELAPSFRKVGYALQQYHEHTNKNAVAAIKILNENNYQNIMSMYSQTNLNAIKAVQNTSLSRIINSLNSVNQPYLKKIQQLSKKDFRINVLEQEIEKDLSIIDQEELTEPNDEATNFYKEIHSDLFIQKKQADDQTKKLDELKLMIVSLAEKISNLENEPRNNELYKYQSDEISRKALKKKIKNFILAFYVVCEFVEHSETAYQLFIWLKNILSKLILLINL